VFTFTYFYFYLLKKGAYFHLFLLLSIKKVLTPTYFYFYPLKRCLLSLIFTFIHLKRWLFSLLLLLFIKKVTFSLLLLLFIISKLFVTPSTPIYYWQTIRYFFYSYLLLANYSKKKPPIYNKKLFTYNKKQ